MQDCYVKSANYESDRHKPAQTDPSEVGHRWIETERIEKIIPNGTGGDRVPFGMTKEGLMIPIMAWRQKHAIGVAFKNSKRSA